MLSAPVEGRLLFDEQPVAGKKVFRRLNYGDEYIDEVTTSSDGRFSFPKKLSKHQSHQTCSTTNLLYNTYTH